MTRSPDARPDSRRTHSASEPVFAGSRPDRGRIPGRTARGLGVSALRAQRVELQEPHPERHAELLAAWLSRPHVVRWWGEQAARVAELLDRQPGTHALIAAGGVPVGYLCWAPPDPAELRAAGLTDLPPGLVDIDILIGEPQLMGRGIGPRALGLLLGRLRRESGFRWAGLGTAVRNRTAISAFEKAGFRLWREFDDPDWGRCRYLVVALRPAV